MDTDQAAADLAARPWNEWTPSELVQLVTHALDRDFPRAFYLVGPPSSAKSSVMREVCEALSGPSVKYHLIDDRLSQKDPTEIAGIRCVPPDPEDPAARILVMPEYRLLWQDCQECRKAKRRCKAVLFFDEHNHAPDLTQKSAYEPVLDASIAGRPFKPGVTRWLAGNRESDNCNITVADRPMRSRVGWIYVRNDFESFMNFVMNDSRPEVPKTVPFTRPSKGVWHPYVISFLRERGPEVCKPASDEAEYFGEPLTRTWEFVSDALWWFEDVLPEMIMKKVVAGFIGPAAAIQFWTWVRTAGKLAPVIDEIIAGKDRTAPTMGQQFFVVQCLLERFRRNPSLAKRLLQYVVAIKQTHGEIGGHLLLRMIKMNRDALAASDEEYTKAKEVYYSILV